MTGIKYENEGKTISIIDDIEYQIPHQNNIFISPCI